VSGLSRGGTRALETGCALFDQLGLTGGEWVLDYESGSGRIARHIAKRLLTRSGHLHPIHYTVPHTCAISIERRLDLFFFHDISRISPSPSIIYKTA